MYSVFSAENKSVLCIYIQVFFLSFKKQVCQVIWKGLLGKTSETQQNCNIDLKIKKDSAMFGHSSSKPASCTNKCIEMRVSVYSEKNTRSHVCIINIDKC